MLRASFNKTEQSESPTRRVTDSKTWQAGSTSEKHGRACCRAIGWKRVTWAYWRHTDRLQSDQPTTQRQRRRQLNKYGRGRDSEREQQDANADDDS